MCSFFVFLDNVVYLYSYVVICIRNPYISHHHIWFSDTVGCLFHFILSYSLAHFLLINSISIIEVHLCKYFQRFCCCCCWFCFFPFFGETFPSSQLNTIVMKKLHQNEVKYTGSSLTQKGFFSQIGVKLA